MFVKFFLLICALHIVSSLMCNKCPKDTTMDYIVTVDSVPSMSSDCTLVEAVYDCSLVVLWVKNPGKSSLSYSTNPTSIPSSFYHVVISVEHRARGYAPQQDTHLLVYNCVTDGCNNATALVRILNALTLTENLNDLESLLAPGTNPPFTEQASCLNISNSTATEQCTPGASSLASCVGCRIQMQSNILCAQCAARVYIRLDDYILRKKIFFLYNGTQSEDAELFCRVKGCNALENVDKIRQASSLEFDFDKFFNGSIPTSSTETLQSVHLYFIIFILLLQQGLSFCDFRI